MRVSLRVQLGVAIVLVTLAVLGLVLLSSRRQLVEEFTRFDGGQDTTYVALAAARLEAWYPHARGLMWPGADSVLATVPHPRRVELVLQSTTGNVVAATRPDLRRAELADGAGGRPVVLSLRDAAGGTLLRLLFDAPPRRLLHGPDGRLVGVVYSFYMPGPARATRSPADPARGLVERVLLWPLLAGALLSIALLIVAASRLLSPLRTLTDATRRLAAGDRATRVAVAGASEMAELSEAFNHMAESLERSESTRRQMVSDVAHELRTPITNLRCRLEAIQDGLAVADATELRGLHDEALLLQQLVEDLNVLALADAGQLPLDFGPGDLRDTAGSAVASFRAQAAAQGVTLALAPGPAAPVEHDAVRMGQVFRNLIANALAHTPRGGEVWVSVEPRGSGAWAEVRDSGEGIAAEHLPHVFDRFWRADAARARATGGAGLGLAIVRQLVALHGGDVAVTSTPGAGAAFQVRLPAGRHPAA